MLVDRNFRIDLKGRTEFDLRRIQVSSLDFELRITCHLQFVGLGRFGKRTLQALAQHFLLHRSREKLTLNFEIKIKGVGDK